MFELFFWDVWEVNVGLVLVVMLDVFQVDDHVQGVGQDKKEDEGGDEAHQDGRCHESSAVSGGGKLTRGNVERLDLRWTRKKRFIITTQSENPTYLRK